MTDRLSINMAFPKAFWEHPQALELLRQWEPELQRLQQEVDTAIEAAFAECQTDEDRRCLETLLAQTFGQQ